MKLIHLVFLMIFILCPQTRILAQNTTDSNSEQDSDIQKPKKKRNLGKKNRKTPKTEEAATSINDTDAESNSVPVEQATTSDTQASAKVTKVREYRGALLGLGLSATPDIYFDTSIAAVFLGLGLLDSETQSNDAAGSQKVNVDVDIGALGVEYGILSASKRLYLQIDANLGRLTFDYGYTSVSSTGTTKSKFKGKKDSLIPGLAIAFEASPGFWIGTKNNWERAYSSSDASEQSSDPTTSHEDMSSRAITLEYRSPVAHAGLNYVIKNDDSETTTWSVPMRIALTEALFLGTSFESENEKDFSSPDTVSGSSKYITEIGFQTPSSALAFQFEYKLKREAESTAGSIGKSKEKSKTGRIIGAFGPKNGLRFGFTTDYALSKESSLSGDDTKSNLIALELSLTRAQ